jgi:hypothetical protein
MFTFVASGLKVGCAQGHPCLHADKMTGLTLSLAADLLSTHAWKWLAFSSSFAF